MRPVEFFTWLLPNQTAGGQPSESRYKMTRQQATVYPGAKCLEGTREVRMLSDDEAERHAPASMAVVAPLRDTPTP